METKSPEQLAGLQLDAYNEKNLAEFIKQYDENITVYDFPSNNITMQGMAAFRERYQKLFEENPNLNAELVNRMVKGKFVMDHEYITGRANGTTGEAIAIYEVNDTHIVKVWFIR